MPQIKFAPISKETQIPGTNFTIQIGIIQNQTRSWGVKLSQNGKIVTAKRIKKLIDVEIVGIIRDTIGKKVSIDTFELGTTMSSLLRETYEVIKSKQKPAEAQADAPQPAPSPTPQISPAPRPQPVGAQISPAPKPEPKAPQISPVPKPPSPPPQPSAPSQSAIEATLADIKVPVSSGSSGSDSFWSAYSSIETPSEDYFDTEPKYESLQPAMQQPALQQPALQQPALQQPALQQPAPITLPQPASPSGDLEDAFAILGVKCPNCGAEVDPDLDNCPYCGQSF